MHSAPFQAANKPLHALKALRPTHVKVEDLLTSRGCNPQRDHNAVVAADEDPVDHHRQPVRPVYLALPERRQSLPAIYSAHVREIALLLMSSFVTRPSPHCSSFPKRRSNGTAHQLSENFARFCSRLAEGFLSGPFGSRWWMALSALTPPSSRVAEPATTSIPTALGTLPVQS